jgi:hypothetical protein
MSTRLPRLVAEQPQLARYEAQHFIECWAGAV